MTVAEKILKVIQLSVDDFNGAIPDLQKELYNDLVKELKKLETKGDNILSNVSNLKLIGSIRNKLEKIILNENYLKNVAGYVQAFDQITALQISYFKEFNNKFRPSKTLKIIQELSVDSTLNSLTEAGINANVLEPVNELLRTNITTGGNFPDLLEALRKRMVSDGKDLGSLERYTKQITTDSLNQYSANYNKTVSEDLGLEWYRYIGSNLTTTREFCEELTKKEWVHKSELAAIIKGKIDGHQCAIYKKTGLPYGMIPETNESNFSVYRGGYSCGHQFFAVPNSAVPEKIKNDLLLRI